jgi:hypothetical protein
MSALSESNEEELVRACRTAIGDSLRSVTYFTQEDYEQLYLRSDLEQDADLRSFVTTEQTGFAERQAYSGSELGDYQFTIRVFDRGYITRVIHPQEASGVFVTTDALGLNGFREVATAIEGTLTDVEPDS